MTLGMYFLWVWGHKAKFSFLAHVLLNGRGILPDWGGMLPDLGTRENNTDHHQRMLYKKEDGYDAAQKI